MTRARMYRPDYGVDGPHTTPGWPRWVRITFAAYIAVTFSFIFGALGRYFGVF